MRSIDLTNVVSELARIAGTDIGGITKLTITPHDLKVNTTYVNGAGQVVKNTLYVPITITLDEGK